MATVHVQSAETDKETGVKRQHQSEFCCVQLAVHTVHEADSCVQQGAGCKSPCTLTALGRHNVRHTVGVTARSDLSADEGHLPEKGRYTNSMVKGTHMRHMQFSSDVMAAPAITVGASASSAPLLKSSSSKAPSRPGDADLVD